MQMLHLVPKIMPYSVTLGNDVTIVATASGMPRRRRTSIGKCHKAKLEFSLQAHDYDYLMAFWRLTRDKPFACRLLTNSSQLQWHKVQWINAPTITNHGAGLFTFNCDVLTGAVIKQNKIIPPNTDTTGGGSTGTDDNGDNTDDNGLGDNDDGENDTNPNTTADDNSNNTYIDNSNPDKPIKKTYHIYAYTDEEDFFYDNGKYKTFIGKFDSLVEASYATIDYLRSIKEADSDNILASARVYLHPKTQTNGLMDYNLDNNVLEITGETFGQFPSVNNNELTAVDKSYAKNIKTVRRPSCLEPTTGRRISDKGDGYITYRVRATFWRKAYFSDGELRPVKDWNGTNLQAIIKIGVCFEYL